MHLSNLYAWNFSRVCSAFIRKYEHQKLYWGFVSIAHVSSIDDDKFQIVRRMDGNFFHKKPLYERIIVDRKTMKCTGMTFEDIEDATYQETYSYQSDPDNSDNTIYNAYLYKSPGVLYWIR